MSIKKLFDLTGKTALITGGSRGLGLQIAEALGEQGATLVLSSRKQDELDEAVEHLKKLGIKASAIVADLGTPEGAAPLVEAAVKQLDHIDILINNAGATWGAPAEYHPVEAWDKVMNLNVRGIFLVAQAVGRASMIPRKSGSIVNVASIAGFRGNSLGTMQTIAYNTSKGAVVNFTRTLAGEWGKYNINVNALAPGFFPSKMTKAVLAQFGEDHLAAHAPLQRIGGDEDLKGAALLLSSAAGRHITGQILAVDGGVLAV